MKTVVLLFIAGCFLRFPFAVCGQSVVTVTGQGYSADTGSVSAGTFVGLTDVEIMENDWDTDLLLQHWVPFTPWSSVPEEPVIGIPVFDPPLQGPDTNFSVNATVALSESSPFRGQPVYLLIFAPRGLGLGPPGSEPVVVVHKSTHVFPSDGSSATFDITIDPAEPRLLAGRIMTTSSPVEIRHALTNAPRSGPLPGYDNWVFAWMGALPAVLTASPDADPDGDGQTNNEEYINGTNPLDTSSLLTLHWTAPPAGTSVTFDFPTRPGIFYSIVQSDLPAMARPAARPADAVWAFDVQTTLTVTVPDGASRRFFAVFSWTN